MLGFTTFCFLYLFQSEAMLSDTLYHTFPNLNVIRCKQLLSSVHHMIVQFKCSYLFFFLDLKLDYLHIIFLVMPLLTPVTFDDILDCDL